MFPFAEMTTMLGPPHPVAMPTVTKMDKLRLAAAKGEMDMVRDLLGLRTPLQPDKVQHLWIVTLHVFALYFISNLNTKAIE